MVGETKQPLRCFFWKKKQKKLIQLGPQSNSELSPSASFCVFSFAWNHYSLLHARMSVIQEVSVWLTWSPSKAEDTVIPLNCNHLRFQEEQILEGQTLQITTVSEGEPSNDHLEEDSCNPQVRTVIKTSPEPCGTRAKEVKMGLFLHQAYLIMWLPAAHLNPSSV